MADVKWRVRKEKMYGTITRPEDLKRFEDEKKRLEETVTITIKRGTLETIFRAFKREPYRDVVFGRPLPTDKQKRIRYEAIVDLQNAFKKIDRPDLPRNNTGAPRKRRLIPFLNLP